VSAIVIDGRAAAARLRARIAARTAALAATGDLVPGLAVVLVGEDPASQIYVGNKTRQAQAAGIRHFDHRLPASVSTAALIELVQRLNERSDVHGILVQLPLPAGIDSRAVLAAIDPDKDVDGFHALNAGRLALGEPATVPCTPLGCLILIRETLAHLGASSVIDSALAPPHSPSRPLAGLRALVIGRSNIVGKPMAQLLLQNDCTVTIAHSRSRDLPELCGQAEILVAAIGHPQAIAGAWIRPGAIVIDVGINRIEAGGRTRLVGDIDYEAASVRAAAITPVPGGVGPMTIACLLLNTLNAALRARFGTSAELLTPWPFP